MPDLPEIPELRPRTLESYVERLTALRRDAEADELNTLGYLIGIATLEVERAVAQGRRERENREADPADLWRPVSGSPEDAS